MSAERTRRAVVTEAEGSKQAAITVSEGNKQAAILNAEGEKQAAILGAEGQRQAAILNAEGFALALEKINEAAAAVGDNTMRLQYLDTLKQVGRSPSSKIVVPMELGGLAAAVAALAQAGGGGRPDGDGSSGS
jgi:regulator of protease activity HflC (stomatin/prohibitin superfamily)